MAGHSSCSPKSGVRHSHDADGITDVQRELLERMASGASVDGVKVNAALYQDMQRRGLIRDSKTITRLGMEAIGRARDILVDADEPLPAIN